jgi:DNA-binding NtrC family response regulator
MATDKTPYAGAAHASDLVSSTRRETVRVLDSPDASQIDRVVAYTSQLTIGRHAAPDVDLVIDDRMISRRHCTFYALSDHGDAFEIEDHGSTNGTSIDGRAVIGKQRAPQQSHVRVGETLLLAEANDQPVANGLEGMVGDSPALRALFQEVLQAARGKGPVLISGETGTGKERVAQAVHAHWARPGPLIAVNCAAIPAELAESSLFGHKRGAFSGALADSPGHFVSADGGTLFLDEIAELSLPLQAKLLRALDTQEVTPVGASVARRVDVRVIAATNAPLLDRVKRKLFREDLYARLAFFLIRTTPLRDRPADILQLFRHFLDQPERRWTTEFAIALLQYDWPRNVRELRAFSERLRVTSRPVLEKSDVDSLFGEAIAPDEFVAPQKAELEALLLTFGGNVSKVAAHLAQHRRQVYRWLRQYAIDAESFRS